MAKEIKREVVKASETKAEAEKAPKKKKVDTETGEKEVVQAKPTGNAVLKRVFAVVFWLLAIAAEVAAIMLLNGYLYIPYDLKTLLIIAIALDLIFVIIGSQFWKKANHINPPSEKNKVWFFLCSQMGLIVAVIAFCPLIVLLLKNKDKLDKKTKVIVTVIAAVALLDRRRLLHRLRSRISGIPCRGKERGIGANRRRHRILDTLRPKLSLRHKLPYLSPLFYPLRGNH